MNIFSQVIDIFQKFTKFQRISVIFIFLLIIFVVPISLFFASQEKTEKDPPSANLSKMWEITFEYNTKNQSLVVKSSKLLDGRATSSQVGLSPYKLQILDSQDKVIYVSDIHIAEEIIYNIYFPPEASSSGFTLPPQPETFESIVYVPYFSEAQKAEVLKNDSKILEFTFPKKKDFSLIEKALAASNSCTSNVKIVFISDGFTDEGKYNQIVNQVSGKFESMSPYSEKPGILEMQGIFNTTSLGCTNGQNLNMECFGNSATWAQVREIIFDRFPDFQGLDADHFKMVILTDTLGYPYGGGQILGAFNGKGGQRGIFATRLKLNNVAAHEVLGHGVGYLWDRYLYGAGHSNSQITSTKNFENNCSDNPDGQDFWKDITGGGGYSGCTSNYLYAPYPRNCGLGGNSNSIMSTASCGAGEFDPVEKVWLRDQILPRYESCSIVATQVPPTSIPTAATITTVPTIGPLTYAIYGYAFEDRNNNGIRDAGDFGRSGIDVSISGTLIKGRTTDDGGYYVFNNLREGSYNLVFNDGSQAYPFPEPIVLTKNNPIQGEYSLILSTKKIPEVITSAPTQAPSQPTVTLIPTQPPGSGGGASPTPTPTPVTTYTCRIDPACTTGQNNLQLCPLICTPN